MQYIKADTSTKVIIGPFPDVSDGFTLLTDVSLSGSPDSDQADAAYVIKHDNATAVDVSGNTWAAITNAAGYYHLTLTSGNTDTEGNLTVIVSDASRFLPVRNDFQVIAANVYDSFFAAAGTDTLDVQVTGMGAGVVTAAAVATGAIDADAIATDAITAAKIAANAIGASELATDAIGDAQIATGAIASTAFAAGAINAAAIATDAIGAAELAADAVTEIQSGLATSAALTTAQNDLDIITGAAGALLDTTATSAQLVDDIWDEVLDAGHNVSQSAGKRIRELQEGGSYADGAVWLDTVNGTAGTDNFVNGVEVSPVDTLADALTIAASVGLKKIRVSAGSSITVNSSIDGYVLAGRNYTLTFGTGSTIGCTVIGASSISGVMRGVGTTQIIEECLVTADLTVQAGTHFIECGIGADILADEGGDYFMDRCHSAIAGNATWTFDFGIGSPVGNTNLSVRNYSGGIRLRHMGDSGTDTASIEGQGNIIEDACSGGAVSVRGLFTTSGITNLTLTEGARIDTTQVKDQVVAALDTDTYAEPGQGTPGATITLAQKIGYLYKSFRNRQTSDTTEIKLYNDDAVTVDQKQTHSVSGGTYDRGEVESGP